MNIEGPKTQTYLSENSGAFGHPSFFSAEDILGWREAWNIADREMAVEWEGLKMELEERKRRKNTPP